MKIVLAFLFVCCFAAVQATSISAASPLSVGFVAGSYKVRALSATPICPVGGYTFSVYDGGRAMIANISYQGEPVESEGYQASTTITYNSWKTFTFNIDVNAVSTCTIIISVGYPIIFGSTTLANLATLFNGVTELVLVGGSTIDSTSTLKSGYVAGDYAMGRPFIEPTCPPGDYTVWANWTGFSAVLKMNGVQQGFYAHNAYHWQTRIGAPSNYFHNFVFSMRPLVNYQYYQCYISIPVLKTGSGTMNLAGVNSLFDDTSILRIDTF
jgi:hypothetical protein